jgi:hypothetical protein
LCSAERGLWTQLQVCWSLVRQQLQVCWSLVRKQRCSINGGALLPHLHGSHALPVLSGRHAGSVPIPESAALFRMHTPLPGHEHCCVVEAVSAPFPRSQVHTVPVTQIALHVSWLGLVSNAPARSRYTPDVFRAANLATRRRTRSCTLSVVELSQQSFERR